MSRTAATPTILIVDDTPTNIQVLAEALRPHYRVKVAASGPAALEVIARQGVPDLILLDVMMPGMDGYAVCQALKESAATRDTPVIFVTAKSDEADEEKGLRLGAVDYIAKPFSLPIVLARVRNHINLKLKTDLLESLALLDGLTSIPNRRRFDEALEMEWKRAQRTGEPLALIMFDIDCFKDYNDHHGHHAGDCCLARVADELTRALARPGDLLARYGGEEFVALLPATDLEGGILSAERCRAQIMALNLPHGHSPAAPCVTVSAGVASLVPGATSSPLELLQQADACLYRAKGAGRNQVCGGS